jgi:hypothetical protein
MAMDTLSFKNSSGTVVTTAVHNDADGNVQTVQSSDGSIATYVAAGGAFAQVATPTVWLVIQGSATKTVRIRRIELSGAATAAGSMPVVVARCSAAGTLGSAVLTGITAAKHDSANAAATAVVSTVGVANYGTPPTVVANLAAGRVNMVALGSAATSSAGNPLFVLGGEMGEQGIVLRGTSEFVTIAGAGAAIPSGGVNDYRIVWTEETE